MLGVACTSVSAKAVFTRDGWQCKHCGQPTPMALRGTVDSRAPELDHILPMNKTWLGAHVQHNCQCLCRGCNGAKGGVSAGTWGQLQAAEPALRGQPMDVLAYYRAAVCVPNGVACASL
jgi:hypothetical protein